MGNACINDQINYFDVSDSTCVEKVFLNLVGRLWTCGFKINWEYVNRLPISAKKISIPTYCFTRTRYEVVKQKHDNKVEPQSLLIDVKIEDQLKKLWSQALGVPEDEIVNASDFFSLGGDSLLFIDLFHSIKTKIKPDLTLEKIIDYYQFDDMLKIIKSNIELNEKLEI